MKVEYGLMRADVTYEQEKELGEDPVRLDFLIIKKDKETVLKDPIGKFFKTVNLFEYKSPEDGLSIDDFYKAQGYSLIYKGFDRKVNELPISELTLTLVRHSYPRELIKELKTEGFEVVEVHNGIYYIKGRVSVDVQLVVTSRLPNGEYEGLKLLAEGATAKNIISYAELAISSGDENVKEYAGTVIKVCLSANEELGERLKEDGKMEDVIRKLFKRDFDEAEQKGMQEGIENDRQRMARDMLMDGKPLIEVKKYSRLAEDVIRNLASSLGVAVI